MRHGQKLWQSLFETKAYLSSLLSRQFIAGSDDKPSFQGVDVFGHVLVAVFNGVKAAECSKDAKPWCPSVGWKNHVVAETSMTSSTSWGADTLRIGLPSELKLPKLCRRSLICSAVSSLGVKYDMVNFF